ncbi:unnamed protein product [Peniophora sp. CBMAI 1063]|nr:unnamed protein product [Peniophora sp. CBMAI 1063]
MGTESNVSPQSEDASYLWLALRQRKAEVHVDLRDGDFRALDSSLADCISVRDIVAVLASSKSILSRRRADGSDTAEKAMGHIAGFLKTFLDVSGEVASAAGVPGGKSVFVAVGLLLQAVERENAQLDAIEKLFRAFERYLGGLQMRQQARFSPQAAKLVIAALKTIQQGLESANKVLRQGRLRRFVAILLQEPDGVQGTMDEFQGILSDIERLSITELVLDMNAIRSELAYLRHAATRNEAAVASMQADVRELRDIVSYALGAQIDIMSQLVGSGPASEVLTSQEPLQSSSRPTLMHTSVSATIDESLRIGPPEFMNAGESSLVNNTDDDGGSVTLVGDNVSHIWSLSQPDGIESEGVPYTASTSEATTSSPNSDQVNEGPLPKSRNTSRIVVEETFREVTRSSSMFFESVSIPWPSFSILWQSGRSGFMVGAPWRNRCVETIRICRSLKRSGDVQLAKGYLFRIVTELACTALDSAARGNIKAERDFVTFGDAVDELHRTSQIARRTGNNLQTAKARDYQTAHGRDSTLGKRLAFTLEKQRLTYSGGSKSGALYDFYVVPAGLTTPMNPTSIWQLTFHVDRDTTLPELVFRFHRKCRERWPGDLPILPMICPQFYTKHEIDRLFENGVARPLDDTSMDTLEGQDTIWVYGDDPRGHHELTRGMRRNRIRSVGFAPGPTGLTRVYRDMCGYLATEQFLFHDSIFAPWAETTTILSDFEPSAYIREDPLCPGKAIFQDNVPIVNDMTAAGIITNDRVPTTMRLHERTPFDGYVTETMFALQRRADDLSMPGALPIGPDEVALLALNPLTRHRFERSP